MNKEVPMSVEDRMIEGFCEGCDQDPAECYLRDYCIYEDDEEDNADD